MSDSIWDMTNTTIHLQGIGTAPAIQLAEVNPGDTLVWNFGITSYVVSVRPVTAKMVELTVRAQDGTVVTQRKRGTTLVVRLPE